MGRIKLSKEILNQVFDSCGLLPDADFKYVPMAWRHPDIPNDLRPVFTLRGIDGVDAVLDEDRLHGKVERDEATGRTSITVQSGEHKLRVCARGIRAWRNLSAMDENGELVPVSDFNADDKTNDIPFKTLRALSERLITELSFAIEKHSVLTEEEKRGFGL